MPTVWFDSGMRDSAVNADKLIAFRIQGSSGNLQDRPRIAAVL
jgi:hypothetical protein